VELHAALDDTTGNVDLTWSRYQGEQPFGAYLVLRNVVMSTVAEALGRIDDVDSLSYVDTTLAVDTAYEYRVVVVNEAGFEAPSEPVRIDGFTARAVTLSTPDPDPVYGRVLLTWSPYRDPGLGRYEVWRRAVGTDADSLLAVLRTVRDTTYQDTTARHGIDYLYRVKAITVDGSRTSANEEGRLDLPSVALSDLRLDARSAAAHLEWPAYDGPRFARYEILRQTSGFEAEEAFTSPDPAQRAFTDTLLEGNTKYRYRVRVITTRNEVVEGPQLQDEFYGLVATWPLDVAEEARVRLLARPGGGLEAAVTDRERVARLRFGATGAVVDAGTIYASPWLSDYRLDLLPTAAAVAMTPDGQEVAAIGHRDRLLIQARHADGTTGWRQIASLSVADTSSPASPVRLSGGLFDFVWGESAIIDSLTIHTEAGAVIREGFAASPDPRLAAFGPSGYPVVELGVARLISASDFLFGSGIRQANGFTYTPGRAAALIVEADVWFESRGATLDLSSGTLWGWVGTARDDIKLVGSVTESAAVEIRDAQRYRITFSHSEGQGSLTVAEPFVDVLDQPVTGWVSVAVHDDFVLYTVDDEAFALSLEEGAASRRVANIAATSDLDLWDSDGKRMLAACQPDLHRVLAGPLSFSSWSGTFTWPREAAGSTVVLGGAFGHDAGEMAYPIAAARSADGRYYVLDAGNERVQVFDADGDYITQWRGGDGGFEFGSGNKATDLAGSICVDDEGYIYVADTGNQRIQVFSSD